MSNKPLVYAKYCAVEEYLFFIKYMLPLLFLETTICLEIL